ncbi:MAG: hypothetical protein AAGM04_06710 [Pseudomonadota bacterium]
MLHRSTANAPSPSTAFSAPSYAPNLDYQREARCIPAAQPYASGFQDPESNAMDGPIPLGRIIRSVVEEAGLGRFIYLAGRSGDRYVFSSIEGRQAAMYRDALFAVIDEHGQPIMLSTRASDVVSATNRIYVHLLKDDGPDADTVISDLKRFSS